MRAILIQPEAGSIEVIDVRNRDDIVAQVGYPTLESDAVGSAGGHLFFNEESFLRDATTDINDLSPRIQYL